MTVKSKIILSLSFLFFLLNVSSGWSQQWQNITEDLLAEIGDTTFSKSTLNRNVGALAVLPESGDLLLVLNGDHPIYRSKNQGKSWKPLNNANPVGRAYGSFSFNIDPVTSRTALFMIVQKKRGPVKGLVLSEKGKVLTEIGRPYESHDGYTWGMVAWEQDNPQVILGKEHHAWVVMWLSKDGGKTWEKLDFESRNPGVIDARTFVAGKDDGGIFRSGDQGKSWEKVAGFKVTGKNPVRYGDNFYWTTEEGLIISRDKGKSWEILGEPLKGALWGPYFGNSENSIMVVNEEGFFITRNHGKSWKKVAGFFVIPDSNAGGKYNVMHPTNSYGWDEKRGIIYAAGLGGHAYKLKLEN